MGSIIMAILIGFLLFVRFNAKTPSPPGKPGRGKGGPDVNKREY